MQGQLPRPTDIMSLRIDNGERATLEYADIALSPTRYIASWLRQRGWRLPDYRCNLLPNLTEMPGASSGCVPLCTAKVKLSDPAICASNLTD